MKKFQPYVSESRSLTEMSLRALIAGAVFGVIFGSANAYLGLKVGLTISTSIPIAVISVALFKALEKVWGKATILESNISQTTGSASSSLASGIIFTIPAVFLWGFDPGLLHIALLGLLGGLLGVTFMIPLRRFLIVEEHENLPYPEGTAAAQVLIAADSGGAKARYVFWGLAVGFFYKALLSFAKLWPEEIKTAVPGLKKTVLGLKASPALLGVGYILGYRISAILVAGSLLSWLGVIPIIAHFGEGLSSPLFPESAKNISSLSASEIWTRYVRYIGAGAVAVAGIITVLRSLPTMINSLKAGLAQLSRRRLVSSQPTERTQSDLNFRVIILVVSLVILMSVATPFIVGLHQPLLVRLIGSIGIVFFAFIFVAVSSRIVGLIGVSSNPTSGMTIVTLLGISMIFYLAGWTDDLNKVAVLTIGTVVAVAASIAGDASQDLKTGFLLGATPQKQQISEIIGVLSSAIFVALAVMALGEVYGFGSPEIPAPQATLMKTVVDGVLQANLPWALVFIGGAFALVAELLSIPSLPFAVGIYLPLSSLTPIYVGGVIRRMADAYKRSRQAEEDDSDTEKGVLLGSGLIAGEGIMGVALAVYAFLANAKPQGVPFGLSGGEGDIVSVLGFALLGFMLFRVATRR